MESLSSIPTGQVIASSKSASTTALDEGGVFRRLTRASKANDTTLDNQHDDYEACAIRPSMPATIQQALATTRLSASSSTTSNSTESTPFVMTLRAQVLGHKKSPLCCAATDNMLFTGGKDRIVRVWDLTQNVEVLSLAGHPNSVVRLLYSQNSRLLFSVSGPFVRAWDIRCAPGGGESNMVASITVAGDENPDASLSSSSRPSSAASGNVNAEENGKRLSGGSHLTANCYRTLFSNGMMIEGGGGRAERAEALKMGREDNLTDAALLMPPGGATELLLTTAPKSSISQGRVWELRASAFNSVAKLTMPSQVTPICICGCSVQSTPYCLVGARDHLVRLYDLSDQYRPVVPTKATFEPPHYDYIQTISAYCINRNEVVAFSGARDGCLKRWEYIVDGGVTQSQTSSAHKSGVSALSILEDYGVLVSAGRDGALRLWNLNDISAPILELPNAHMQAINGLDVNRSGHVFTVADDRSIRIWKLTNGTTSAA